VVRLCLTEPAGNVRHGLTYETPMFDKPELQFAINAVREASHLARRIQRETLAESLTKDDRSPVTVADFAIQAIVARRLAERLPGSVLIGEEQADALRLREGLSTLEQITGFVRSAIHDATPEEVCGLIDRGSGEPPATFWTLDPIDGTKGFLRREQYAIALALIDGGEVKLGVLGCPELKNALQPNAANSGSLTVAARGQGTWACSLNGNGQWHRLNVSSRREVKDALVLRSVEKAHTNVDEIGQLAAKLGITVPPVAMDSQAKYAVLAAGEGDVLLRLLSPSRPDYREKIWDQAAGSIVVTEAGGRISDLDGLPLDFSHGRTLAKNRGILATNGQLHHAVLSALRALGA
jgi:3'(2'), 5'-bisphosphate nucleotidase